MWTFIIFDWSDINIMLERKGKYLACVKGAGETHNSFYLWYVDSKSIVWSVFVKGLWRHSVSMNDFLPYRFNFAASSSIRYLIYLGMKRDIAISQIQLPFRPFEDFSLEIFPSIHFTSPITTLLFKTKSKRFFL